MGDTAVWKGQGIHANTKITQRREYRSFESMLQDIGYENLVPKAKSFKEQVSRYAPKEFRPSCPRNSFA
nr:hypothetical protein [Rickettsiella endosymbiont of Dermanyssus gallinae]